MVKIKNMNVLSLIKLKINNYPLIPTGVIDFTPEEDIKEAIFQYGKMKVLPTLTLTSDKEKGLEIIGKLMYLISRLGSSELNLILENLLLEDGTKLEFDFVNTNGIEYYYTLTLNNQGVLQEQLMVDNSIVNMSTDVSLSPVFYDNDVKKFFNSIIYVDFNNKKDIKTSIETITKLCKENKFLNILNKMFKAGFNEIDSLSFLDNKLQAKIMGKNIAMYQPINDLQDKYKEAFISFGLSVISFKIKSLLITNQIKHLDSIKKHLMLMYFTSSTINNSNSQLLLLDTLGFKEDGLPKPNRQHVKSNQFGKIEIKKT